MRMADTSPSGVVIPGGIGPLPTDNPPEIGAPAVESHVDVLCHDAPIGRIVSVPHPHLPTFVASYLSVDIELTWRDTSCIVGRAVDAAAHDFLLRGGFWVLTIQVRVRPFTWRREPAQWVTGFDQFGDPAGRWPLARFQPYPGVDLTQLLALAHLSWRYDRNMQSSPHRRSAVLFIPREDEDSIREIAACLAGNARGC